MPYVPTKWEDRVRTLPDRFYLHKNDDDTYTLTPAGEIMVEGTPRTRRISITWNAAFWTPTPR